MPATSACYSKEIFNPLVYFEQTTFVRYVWVSINSFKNGVYTSMNTLDILAIISSGVLKKKIIFSFVIVSLINLTLVCENGQFFETFC